MFTVVRDFLLATKPNVFVLCSCTAHCAPLDQYLKYHVVVVVVVVFVKSGSIHIPPGCIVLLGHARGFTGDTVVINLQYLLSSNIDSDLMPPDRRRSLLFIYIPVIDIATHNHLYTCYIYRNTSIL